MATKHAFRRWTYEEFSRLPDDGNRYEVIAGELHVTPAPQPLHQLAVVRLGGVLESFVGKHEIGWIMSAPIDVLFAEGDYFQPDLAFVRYDREPIITKRGIEEAPDLVVEVLSGSTKERDRGLKRQRYALFGVPEYWIVDPEERTIEVHRLNDGPVMPRIVRDTLEWQPFAGAPTLQISVQEVLRGFARR